jgi:hypothetical protein
VGEVGREEVSGTWRPLMMIDASSWKCSTMIGEGGPACCEHSKESVGGLAASVARLVAKHPILDHPTAILKRQTGRGRSTQQMQAREVLHLRVPAAHAFAYASTPRPSRALFDSVTVSLRGKIEVNPFGVLGYHLNASRAPQRHTCSGVSLPAAESR